MEIILPPANQPLSDALRKTLISEEQLEALLPGSWISDIRGVSASGEELLMQVHYQKHRLGSLKVYEPTMYSYELRSGTLKQL